MSEILSKTLQFLGLLSLFGWIILAAALTLALAVFVGGLRLDFGNVFRLEWYHNSTVAKLTKK